MPRYGTCSECGTTVWLTEGDACPQGHGAECISGIAESSSPPAAPIAPAAPLPGAPKRKTGLIIGIVVAVLLLCCLGAGMIAALSIPVFDTARSSAAEQGCFAEQRVLEGSAMQWAAAEEGRSTSDIEDYGALVEAVVPEYAFEEPLCADDGTYDWDPATGEVTCSVHGHYE